MRFPGELRPAGCFLLPNSSSDWISRRGNSTIKGLRGGGGGGGDPVLSLSRISAPRWETSSLSCRTRNIVELCCKNISEDLDHPTIPAAKAPGQPGLAFDRLQVSDEGLCRGNKRSFDKFVARGALVDEEYWAAAWQRAEVRFESAPYMRHVNMYKRDYSEKEFYSLKRRCAGRDGNSLKCTCIVVVKKEDPNIRRTVLNSVVGNLDLSIRQFFHGQSFPGDLKKASDVLVRHEVSDSRKYAYIANVCVVKSSRRQGIASNMLHFAADVALASGMKQLYIHVNADNHPALDMYKKIGFMFVEEASSSSSCPPPKNRWLLMRREF